MPYERMVIDGKEYFRCGMCNQIYEYKPENRIATYPGGYTREGRHYCKYCLEKYDHWIYSKANGKRRYQEAKKNGTDWYHRNPEYYKAKSRERNRNKTAHRYGADGWVTNEEWNALLNLFEFKCAYCGSDGTLCMDHVIPLSRRGENKINNIVPACRSCNSSKHDAPLAEWYVDQPFYSRDRFIKIIDHIKEKDK